jgi:Protein of unknown function (DUF2934)
MSRQHTTIDHSRIANLAYSYWQARGRPFGSADVDWFHAEKKLGYHPSHELPSLWSLHREPDEEPWR